MRVVVTGGAGGPSLLKMKERERQDSEEKVSGGAERKRNSYEQKE